MTGVVLLAASKVDVAVFAVCAVAILVGALGVILSRNPIHSALMLVMTLFGVAVLFLAQEAHFLAAVQVIVYAGAIVVLFLFVIMLLGVDQVEDLSHEPLRGQRPVAVILGLVAMAQLVFLGGAQWASGATAVAGPSGPGASNVETLARSLFTRYLYAFELTSILLVIAVVGAVLLAKRQPLTASNLEGSSHENSPRAAGVPHGLGVTPPHSSDEPAGEEPTNPAPRAEEPAI